MKLSEAIILGSASYPQSHGPGVNGHRCALESAAEALGDYVHGHTNFYDLVIATWPWVNGHLVVCPACDYRCACCHMRVVVAIYHLNDQHKWTRPRIAAWVAAIEPEAMGDRPTVGQQTLTLEIEVRGLVPQPQEAIPCSL